MTAAEPPTFSIRPAGPGDVAALVAWLRTLPPLE